MGYRRISFVLSAVLVCSVGAFAKIKLPAVISDNMVIQQGMEAPIWGWAEPGEKIEVVLNNRIPIETTSADESGRWMVKLHAQKAGGPYRMTVKGENTITLNNVLVGEVWVCSGQSNMEMAVSRSANAEQEIAAANYPGIRLFTVERNVADKPQLDCVGSWQLCSPENAGSFSAAAYFFGRELHNELGAPIGLIHTSWGGTPAEAWSSSDVFKSDPDFAPLLEQYLMAVAKYPQARKEYERQVSQWEQAVAKTEAQGKKLPRKPRMPKGMRNRSGLYNAMIAPLMPYGIKGAIWYQGESNRKRAYQYRKLFPAMIKGWRDGWGQGDFPFYYVQIAPFKYKDAAPVAAELREAQLMTLSVPNTGMAVTMDIGDVNDIHPKNKQAVGRRLSLWALAKSYGRKGIVCSGPIYRSMKIEGDKIRLFFDYAGGGLVAKGGKLTCFTIAGKDRQFVEAKAEIGGDTIVVSSDKVKEPVAVRYAWSNAAVPNLFNKVALPASSFRTDNWPGITVNKK